MVWALAIVCVSLSCEPAPVVMGWFLDEDECKATAHMVSESWKPSVGFYSLHCFMRREV